METIIITLLGINLYLLIDYILDNYYFNGTRAKGILILNRHLYYEIIQIWLFAGLIIILLSSLQEVALFGWIFSLGFVVPWAIRIRDTFKNRECEIRIGKEKVVFVDHEGNENAIELPNYFSICKEEGNRFSITSKSMDYILYVKNKKGEELMVNLSGSSLGSYSNQIRKTVIRNFGTLAYEGIKPWKWIDLKKLSISLLILVVLLIITIINQPK
jgi:hypothetical protein